MVQKELHVFAKFKVVLTQRPISVFTFSDYLYECLSSPENGVVEFVVERSQSIDFSSQLMLNEIFLWVCFMFDLHFKETITI